MASVLQTGFEESNNLPEPSLSLPKPYGFWITFYADGSFECNVRLPKRAIYFTVDFKDGVPWVTYRNSWEDPFFRARVLYELVLDHPRYRSTDLEHWEDVK